MRQRILAGCVFLAGCSSSGHDPTSPGTPLGTYEVRAKRLSDSCGEAPAVWDFTVKLSKDTAKLYWVQGGTPVEARISSKGSYEFVSEDTRVVREADKVRELGACILSRADFASLELATDEKSFSGELRYDFTPGAAADCRDQIAEFGGAFQALPCSQKFSLDATRSTAK